MQWEPEMGFLKYIGSIVAWMLMGGTCGFLLESMPRRLFPEREKMFTPGLILTVVFTLVFTFLTPLGRFFFSLFSSGKGEGTFVIFGGPVPLPIITALLGFLPLILLGAAASVIFLCLLDFLAGALGRRR